MGGPVQTNGESVSPVAAVIRAGECAFLKILKQVFDIKVWDPTILKNVEIIGVSKVISMAQNVIGIKFLKLSKYKQCQSFSQGENERLWCYLLLTLFAEESKTPQRPSFCASFFVAVSLIGIQHSVPSFLMLRVFYFIIYKVPISRWSIVVFICLQIQRKVTSSITDCFDQ